MWIWSCHWTIIQPSSNFHPMALDGPVSANMASEVWAGPPWLSHDVYTLISYKHLQGFSMLHVVRGYSNPKFYSQNNWDSISRIWWLIIDLSCDDQENYIPLWWFKSPVTLIKELTVYIFYKIWLWDPQDLLGQLRDNLKSFSDKKRLKDVS